MASLENFPVRWLGRQAVVTLPAEIDISNADAITDLLLAVLNQDVSVLVADMTGTTFCACAGVNSLTRARLRARDNRTQLRVAAGAPIVSRIFALTGLDRAIPIFGTVPAALAGPVQEPVALAGPVEEQAASPEDGDPTQQPAVT
jgi:anti-sigma B factor antagonist